MFRKIKTMLGLLLIALMAVVTVPVSALAEEDTQEIVFGAEEIKGEIVEELDMSNFTIVVLDKDGNVKPMVMPMSTTTVQTWPDMTLGAGETFIFYNNKNNGYVNVPSGSSYGFKCKTNKDFKCQVGVKRSGESSFKWTPSYTATTKDDYYVGGNSGNICIAIKNLSSFSVKLSNLRFDIFK